MGVRKWGEQLGEWGDTHIVQSHGLCLSICSLWLLILILPDCLTGQLHWQNRSYRKVHPQVTSTTANPPTPSRVQQETSWVVGVAFCRRVQLWEVTCWPAWSFVRGKADERSWRQRQNHHKIRTVIHCALYSSSEHNKCPSVKVRVLPVPWTWQRSQEGNNWH